MLTLLKSELFCKQISLNLTIFGKNKDNSERKVKFQYYTFRASLVAQWLRIRLPMQGTRVRALVREDPTCRGATKPVRHNY